MFDATREQFVAAADLDDGATLVRLDGTLAQPGRTGFHFEAEQHEPVFNLTVEETETYFAEGVLVHNKSPAPYGVNCSDQPEHPECEDESPDQKPIEMTDPIPGDDCDPDSPGGASGECDPNSQGGQGGSG